MRYGRIDISILENNVLSINAKAVYLVLGGYRNKYNIAFPSIKRIAETLQISTVSASKAIQELKDHQIITVASRYCSSNIYHFLHTPTFKYDFSVIESNLSITAKVIFVLLKNLKQTNISSLTEKLGINPHTSSKYLTELHQAGLLKLQRQGYSKIYTLSEQTDCVVDDVKKYQNIKVPNAIIHHKTLSCISKSMYIVLLTRKKNNCDNTVFVSNATLKKELKCGYLALCKAIKELQSYGYITITTYARGKQYILNVPSKSFTTLNKALISDPRVGYRYIYYYAINQKKSHLTDCSAYRHLKAFGYVQKCRFIDIKAQKSNQKGHIVNIQKKVNLYKNLYITGFCIKEAIQCCNAIAYDYQKGGKLYDIYCISKNKIDFDTIYLNYQFSDCTNMTAYLYQLFNEDTIPIKRDNKHNSLSRKEVFIKKIKNFDQYHSDRGYLIKVIDQTNQHYYVCTNASRNIILTILSVNFRLSIGQEYYVQIEPVTDTACKENRNVLVYAAKKEDCLCC